VLFRNPEDTITLPPKIQRLKTTEDYVFVQEETGNLRIWDKAKRQWKMRDKIWFHQQWFSYGSFDFQVYGSTLYELKKENIIHVIPLEGGDAQYIKVPIQESMGVHSIFSVEGYRILMQMADGQLGFLDLSFPCLASYSLDVIQNNLEILKEMNQSLLVPQLEKILLLRQQLDAEISQQLEQFVFPPLSLHSTERIQLFLCLQLLLHGLCQEDETIIIKAFEELYAIDPAHPKNLNTLLARGRCSPVPLPMTLSDRSPSPRSLADSFIPTCTWIDSYVKVYAVQNFQEQCFRSWKEEKPLLASLGIASRKDYETYLNCSPDFLETAGIQSVEDLECLGIQFIQETYFVFIEEGVEQKEAILSYLEYLKLVCNDILWSAKIQDLCLLLEAETLSQELIAQLNEGIEAFHFFYKEQQIKTLRDYLHQFFTHSVLNKSLNA
jgi:hypothetical protein